MHLTSYSAATLELLHRANLTDVPYVILPCPEPRIEQFDNRPDWLIVKHDYEAHIANGGSSDVRIVFVAHREVGLLWAWLDSANRVSRIYIQNTETEAS